MLLSCHINLVKLEKLWLSKILRMTYNSEWREYNYNSTSFLRTNKLELSVAKQRKWALSSATWLTLEFSANPWSYPSLKNRTAMPNPHYANSCFGEQSLKFEPWTVAIHTTTFFFWKAIHICHSGNGQGSK